MVSEKRNIHIQQYKLLLKTFKKTLDNKQLAMGIFLDLSKAFDVINHNLLLAKLELYGLRGKIHVWLSSYLTD
jgi:hypothetical protein